MTEAAHSAEPLTGVRRDLSRNLSTPLGFYFSLELLQVQHLAAAAGDAFLLS